MKPDTSDFIAARSMQQELKVKEIKTLTDYLITVQAIYEDMKQTANKAQHFLGMSIKSRHHNT